ncbi:hypothetical protein RM553_19210 [Zunongwangia sp. F363]|uniref:Uncharacterized protein n=1 Tax=Autumnicola tepida TaxID=3075595 RepID=A0ABU3CF62_9FLAO|nr:hypothetical protein [Zunongwangia sp. F363]MDT0644970.1 hypothetical protein [Zunongwangia sp. F363]
MSEINLKVKQNYEYLEELSFSEKNIQEDTIFLKEKNNRKDWLKNSVKVEHSTAKDEMSLIIEKKLFPYKYGIKLHCPNFTEKPFFRFDSDGPTHRNKIENSLAEQPITTPHFNTYDEKGQEFAYKSDILRNDKEAKAIAENIEFGISHFFQETNIKLNGKDEFPGLTTENPELFEIESQTDPLNGIEFLD